MYTTWFDVSLVFFFVSSTRIQTSWGQALCPDSRLNPYTWGQCQYPVGTHQMFLGGMNEAWHLACGLFKCRGLITPGCCMLSQAIVFSLFLEGYYVICLWFPGRATAVFLKDGSPMQIIFTLLDSFSLPLCLNFQSETAENQSLEQNIPILQGHRALFIGQDGMCGTRASRVAKNHLL